MRYTMHDVLSTFHAGHLIGWRDRVIALLSQGASGAVYLVADERTHQKLFVLKEVMHAFREERDGFPFDVAALKQLDHPALPRIYRVFYNVNHDRFYILMDYVEGSSLEVMRPLLPGKRFSLHAAMTLMSPIMDAVSYLHRQHPHLIHVVITTVHTVARAIHVALFISSHDSLATVDQCSSELWDVIPANQMGNRTPKLPMVGPAGEHMGPLVIDPMITLSIEEKKTGADVNS